MYCIIDLSNQQNRPDDKLEEEFQTFSGKELPERRWHYGSKKKTRRKYADKPEKESKRKFTENHMPHVSEGNRKD